MIEFDQGHEEQGQGLGVLGFGDQEQGAQVDRAPLEALGQGQAEKPEIEKRQGLEYPAVEGVIGIVACPVVGPAILQEL